jgi:hypothetical protein
MPERTESPLVVLARVAVDAMTAHPLWRDDIRAAVCVDTDTNRGTALAGHAEDHERMADQAIIDLGGHAAMLAESIGRQFTVLNFPHPPGAG